MGIGKFAIEYGNIIIAHKYVYKRLRVFEYEERLLGFGYPAVKYGGVFHYFMADMASMNMVGLDFNFLKFGNRLVYGYTDRSC